MRKTFLEESYTMCGGKTNPKRFPRKLKLSTYLDQ